MTPTSRRLRAGNGALAAIACFAGIATTGLPALADSSAPAASCPTPGASGSSGASGASGSSAAKPVCRLQGGDRIGTAIATSQQEFPAAHSAGAVVLTASYDFPDAMSGGPLGKDFNAPVLLTQPGELTPATLTEIQRVLPAPAGSTGTTAQGCGGAASGPTAPADAVYIIGGDAAIASSIDTQLNQAGYNVVRVIGRNRFATSVAVAACEGNPSTVFLATGDIFADTLAAGPAAAQNHGTVLLTDGRQMPAEVGSYVQNLTKPTVWAIGQAATDAAKRAGITAQPIVGGDRFATAALVASDFFPNPTIVGVATGYDFPDALAGGAFMGNQGGPVLLTDPDSLQSADGLYLGQRHAGIQEACLFGGPHALSPRVEGQVRAVINQS